MPDNFQDRGPADRDRVNIHEAHELRYWTKRFTCTADQLRAAAVKAGAMAAAVERELRRRAT